jgi:chromosomal replication initiation ATPase DnaA
MGLSAELHQPDYETKFILKISYIATVLRFEEIIEYVARNIKSNVRELEEQ